jgi:hypothetical protein
MSRTIIAISANTNPKRWVMNTINRFDNTISVELTDDIELSYDFLTMSAAKQAVSVIYNPYDRVYKAEKVKVLHAAPVEESLKGLK